MFLRSHESDLNYFGNFKSKIMVRLWTGEWCYCFSSDRPTDADADWCRRRMTSPFTSNSQVMNRSGQPVQLVSRFWMVRLVVESWIALAVFLLPGFLLLVFSLSVLPLPVPDHSPRPLGVFFDELLASEINCLSKRNASTRTMGTLFKLVVPLFFHALPMNASQWF